MVQAREAAKGATAYLNLECGDCHGDLSAVQTLAAAGVSRVVVGLKHPLGHLRGEAVQVSQIGTTISSAKSGIGEGRCSDWLESP